MDMEMSLADLFVLSACGKLSALKVGDDLCGGHAFGALHDEAERSNGAFKNRSTLVEGKDALVEKGFKKGRGDSSAG
jgi:hypothetical protein